MSVSLAILSSEVIEKETLYEFVLQQGGYRHGQKVSAHLASGVAHISIVRDNSIVSSILADSPTQYQKITKELGNEPQTGIVIDIGGREAEKNHALAFEFIRACMEKCNCILTTLTEEYIVYNKQYIQEMYGRG